MEFIGAGRRGGRRRTETSPGTRAWFRPAPPRLADHMKTKTGAVISLAVLIVLGPLRAVEPPLLATQAHAHNDYMHERPLFDALDHGFCSVEADIYLVDGELLVAHERRQVKPGRTLQALYLDPIRERVKRYHGSVHSGGPEFTLLIDLKQDWHTLYPALRNVLTNYADMLTTFSDRAKRSNAVLVIITGNRNEAMFAGETVRYAAYDGELSDLETNPPALLVPWISANWSSRFHWNGAGTMPEAELGRLKAIVAQAHEQGRRVRFWGAPDNPNFWQAIYAAGVDLINTDNLAGVAQFFLDRRKQAR